ncbi:unnamed protein product [Sphagnum tenellum]
MVHTLSHTEPLQCSADGIWEALKHADEILPAVMPDYFTKSVFLQGHGEPGTIRLVKTGPGMTALGWTRVINPPLFTKIVLADCYLQSGFYSMLDLDGAGSRIGWSLLILCEILCYDWNWSFVRYFERNLCRH